MTRLPESETPTPRATSRQFKASAESPTSRRSDSRPRLVSPYKWTRALSCLRELIGTLLNDAAVSDDLFEHIVTFVCVCLGQDYSIDVQSLAPIYQILKELLSTKSGRRGEAVVRTILEGKSTLYSMNEGPEFNRKVTKGAVM